MQFKNLYLKKNQDRRVRSGHPWIYSNEIDTQLSPIKSFKSGELVQVQAYDKTPLGVAYINPHSLIAARVLSKDINEEINIDFFIKRLQTALALRETLFTKPFYRLIFSEADFLPGIIIDRYNHDFVIQINTAGMEQFIDIISAALQQVFPKLNSILLRNDTKSRTQEGLELYVKPLYGEPAEEIIIEENAVRFYMPLLKGQKTGWFYDHRQNRARMQAYVKDKEVLDVFSYLGGWAIQMAAFGASHVDCIETSTFACDFINRNAKLNQLDHKVHAICDDAFEGMKKLLQEKKQYDVIVIDPPAFIKKAKDKEEGSIAYQRCNELGLRLLKPGGILVSCSCSMHMGEADLIQSLRRAAYRTNNTVQLIERGHQGADHPLHICIPETDYLKAIFLRKL